VASKQVNPENYAESGFKLSITKQDCRNIAPPLPPHFCCVFYLGTALPELA
jgi:hypothetical protein